MKKYLIILAGLVVAAGLFLTIPPLLHGGGQGPANPEAPPLVEEPEEEAISLCISAVGDVMVHKSQIPAQYDEATGTYNFDNNFDYVKKYIEEADLALCNLETTFAGGTYSGYPMFNAPESLADAIKKAGFDLVVTANNHNMDKGLSGMKRTLEVTRAAGLATAGTHLEGEKDYTILEVKGVKIGIVAYSYETPMVGSTRTINGNQISDAAWELLSTFRYYNLDEDLQKIRRSMENARAEGAEILVCYFHWGEEYQRSPNEYQQYIAMEAAKYGADVIFASHPHVLQGVELLTPEGAEKKVPVFYSMGNFISNQRTETLDNRYTEQGMIARVRLEYMKSTGQVLSLEMDALPTWVDKYKKNGKDVYAIIPLDGTMAENPSLVQSGHLSRAERALADVKALLGEEYIRAGE